MSKKEIEKSNTSVLQQYHYERINAEYEKHYFDVTSMNFRKKFIYEFLFKDLDLNNKLVADLACSSGNNSKFVLSQYPKAKVIGFDISESACEAYKKNTNSEAYKIDLTINGSTGDIQADVVMIVGGLHHCCSNLQNTFNNIKTMIKPGGWLLMVEPNRECVFEWIRKIWYKHDKYFEPNTEHALSHKELFSLYGNGFSIVDCKYMGGPAYFLIYNSLIFRIPIRYKSTISPVLTILERWYNKLPGKFFYPYFIARWQRC